MFVQSFSFASRNDPATRAELLKVSGELEPFGIPVDQIRENLPLYKRVQQAVMVDREKLRRVAPQAFELYTQPEFAQVAYDLVPEVSLLEGLWADKKRGWMQNTLGKLAAPLNYRDLSPEEWEQIARYQADIERMGTANVPFLSPALTLTGQVVEGIATSLPYAGAGAGLGAAAGSAGGPLAPATSTAGAITGFNWGMRLGYTLNSYRVNSGLAAIGMREQGYSMARIRGGMIATGLAMTGLEVVGAMAGAKILNNTKLGEAFRFLKKRNPLNATPIRDTAKVITLDAGIGTIGETGTELLQTLAEFYGEDLARGGNLPILGPLTGEVLEDVAFLPGQTQADLTSRLQQGELGPAMWDTFSEVVQGMTVLGASGAAYRASRLKSKEKKMVTVTQDWLTKLQNAPDELAKRAPSQFAAFLRQVSQGSGAEAVKIPLGQLREKLKEAGISIDEAREIITELDQAEELEKTHGDGVDVVIPIDRLKTAVVPRTDLFEALKPAMRLDDDPLSFEEFELQQEQVAKAVAEVKRAAKATEGEEGFGDPITDEERLAEQDLEAHTRLANQIGRVRRRVSGQVTAAAVPQGERKAAVETVMGMLWSLYRDVEVDQNEQDFDVWFDQFGFEIVRTVRGIALARPTGPVAPQQTQTLDPMDPTTPLPVEVDADPESAPDPESPEAAQPRLRRQMTMGDIRTVEEADQLITFLRAEMLEGNGEEDPAARVARGTVLANAIQAIEAKRETLRQRQKQRQKNLAAGRKPLTLLGWIAQKGGFTMEQWRSLGVDVQSRGDILRQKRLVRAKGSEGNRIYDIALEAAAAGFLDSRLSGDEKDTDGVETALRDLVNESLDGNDVVAVTDLWTPERMEKMERDAMSGRAPDSPEEEAADFEGEDLGLEQGDFEQDGDAAYDEGSYRPEVVAWAKERFGDRVAPNGRPVYQNFVAWFGDSKVVDEDGQPRTVYHGTTRNFTGAFDVEAAETESDMGAGVYLSSSAQDAGMNYGDPSGPDVVGRIDRLTEEIDDGDYEGAKEEAQAEILQNLGTVIPAVVSMQNPVVIGGPNRTEFDLKVEYDDDGDVVSESGGVVDLVNAVNAVASSFEVDDFDVELAVGALVEAATDYDGVSALDVAKILKDKLQYATDDSGKLVVSELVRSVFERMGFDGIIDNTVSDKFIRMQNLPAGTTHYIAFNPSSVKSTQNRGDFSQSVRILEQTELAKIPESVDLPPGVTLVYVPSLARGPRDLQGLYATLSGDRFENASELLDQLRDVALEELGEDALEELEAGDYQDLQLMDSQRVVEEWQRRTAQMFMAEGPDIQASEAGTAEQVASGVAAEMGGETVPFAARAAAEESTRAVTARRRLLVLEQTDTVRRGDETLEKYGLEPGKRYKVREVASALEARQRELYGEIGREQRDDETRENIARWMVAEVLFEFENPEDSGVGWYSTKFQKALDIAGDTFPELKTDKAARDTFTALIAMTSDGQTPEPNFLQAADIYERYRETGELTVQRSTARAASVAANLSRLKSLFDRLGVEATHQFLMQEMPIRDLKKEAAKQGLTLKSDYQVHIQMPMAAVVFGPKLGAFYANMMGAYGYLTMDRWWSRTFNRYRGTLVQAPTRDGLKRFKRMLKNPRMSDDEAIAATVPYRKSYEAKGFKRGTKIEKAANTIYKAAFEALEDRPFNASDRTFMLDATGQAKDILRDEHGIDLSIADIQAVLWYYEKKLYGELGSRQSAKISYEEAARRHAAGRPDAVRRRPDGEDRPSAGLSPEELGGQPYGGVARLSARPGRVAAPEGTTTPTRVEGAQAEPRRLYRQQPQRGRALYSEDVVVDGETPPMTSALSREVAALNVKEAKPQAWIDAVQGLVSSGRVKKEELTQVGLLDALAAKRDEDADGKLTKDQVVEMVGARRVELAVKTLGETSSQVMQQMQLEDLAAVPQAVEEARKNLEVVLPQIIEDLRGFEPDAAREMEDVYSQIPNMDGPALLQVYLDIDDIDGLEQLLLDYTSHSQLADPFDSGKKAPYTDTTYNLLGPTGDVLQEPRTLLVQLPDGSRPDYQQFVDDAHYPGERDVLVWNRLNTATNKKGQRVTLLQENQSDYAQQARGRFAPADTTEDEHNNWTGDRRYFPAPFVGRTDSWAMLGLKTALIDAVQRGHQQLQVVDGDTIRRRWGEDVGIDTVDVVPDAGGTGLIQINLNLALARARHTAGILRVTPEGKIVESRIYDNGDRVMKPLRFYEGKPLSSLMSAKDVSLVLGTRTADEQVIQTRVRQEVNEQAYEFLMDNLTILQLEMENRIETRRAAGDPEESIADDAELEAFAMEAIEAVATVPHEPGAQMGAMLRAMLAVAGTPDTRNMARNQIIMAFTRALESVRGEDVPASEQAAKRQETANRIFVSPEDIDAYASMPPGFQPSEVALQDWDQGQYRHTYLTDEKLSQPVRWGGEWALQHYDNLLPKLMAKLARKHGGEFIPADSSTDDRAEAVYYDVQGRGVDRFTARFATIVITPELRAAVEQQQLELFSEEPAGPEEGSRIKRGRYLRRQLGDRVTRTLELMEKANPSTIYHELAHVFFDARLEALERQLSDPALPQSQRLQDTMMALFEAMGVGKPGDTIKERVDAWNALSPDEQVVHHEAVARNFEIYLGTGQAPTRQQKRLFQQIAQFMRDVYRDVVVRVNEVYQQLYGRPLFKIDDRVRRAFDSMVAAEEDIDQEIERTQTPDMSMDFPSVQEMADDRDTPGQLPPPVGDRGEQPEDPSEMDDDQLGRAIDEMGADAREEQQPTPEDDLSRGMSEAQEMRKESRDDAVDQLTRALLRDAEVLDEITGKKTSSVQAEARRARREVKQQVEAEVGQRRVHRLRRFLRTGVVIDKDGDEQQAMEGNTKLNSDQVRQLMPGVKLNDLGGGLTSPDGMDLDVAADLFGYDSATQMVADLRDSASFKDEVSAAVDREMLDRYGELATPAAVRQTIQRAIYNEARQRAVLKELETVSGAALPEGVTLQALRRVATERIGKMRVRDLQPHRFQNDAMRARREAFRHLRAGNRYKAAQAFRAEMLYNAMVREAATARRNFEMRIRRIEQKYAHGRDKQKAKTLDMRFVYFGRKMLSTIGLGNQPGRADEQVEQLSRYDPEFFAAHQDLITSMAGFSVESPFDLTGDNLSRALDMVDAAYDRARTAKTIEIAGKRFDRDELAKQLVQQLVDMGKVDLEKLTEQLSEKTVKAWSRMSNIAQMKRLEQALMVLDGGKEGGLFASVFYQPLREALDRSDRVLADQFLKLQELAQAVSELEKGAPREIEASELRDSRGRPFVFGKSRRGDNGAIHEIVTLIANLGNVGNRNRVMSGYEWGQRNKDGNYDITPVIKFLNRMLKEGVITREVVDMAQGIMDVFESMKPDFMQALMDIEGRYVSEVQPTSFTLMIDGKPVRFRGGYVPVRYDPDQAELGPKMTAEAQARAVQLNLSSSATNERTGDPKQQVNLRLDSLLGTFQEHVRYAYVVPTVKKLRDLLEASDTQEAVGTTKRMSLGTVLKRMNPGFYSDDYNSVLRLGLYRASSGSLHPATAAPAGPWLRAVKALRRRMGSIIFSVHVRNAVENFGGLIGALSTQFGVKARYMASTWDSRYADLEYIQEHSDMMWGRLQKGAQQIVAEDFDPKTLKEKLSTRWSYAAPRFTQQIFEAWVWKAAHDQWLAEMRPDGMFDATAIKEAARYADRKVRLNTGSGDLLDAPVYEGAYGEMGRLFTQFTGWFAYKNSMAQVAWARAKQEGGVAGWGRFTWNALALFYLEFLVTAALAEWLKGGDDDLDDDERFQTFVVNSAIKTPMRMILAGAVPVAGDIAGGALEKLVLGTGFGIEGPRTGAFDWMTRNAAKTLKLFQGEFEGQELRAAVELAAGILGGDKFLIPAYFGRQIGYGAQLATGEADPEDVLEVVRGMVQGR